MTAETKTNGNGKKLVFVIEDDKDVNDMLREELEHHGYDTLATYTGENVVETARERRPDVILLDVSLPGVDGVKLCESLMKDRATSSIPVIMVTARNDLHTKISSFMAGAKRYINKPFTAAELILEIQHALAQKERGYITEE